VKPAILVSGATGKTGAPAALQLLARGFPVRALVHQEDARSDGLRRAGAQVIVGSLEDIDDLTEAMRGVRRAYFCPPLASGTLRRAALFATAATEAKLEVVVILSQWLTDPMHRSLHASEKWLSSRVFEWAPIDVVTVNPGWFADNYMAALEPITQLGVMGMPLAEGLNAPPSNEDVARVIAAALADPAPHVGKTYRPTGPRLLSPHEIAATFAKVLGRPVRYQNAPLGLFLKVAKSLGLSDYLIAQLYWFLHEYQRGSFAIGAPTDVVQDVGGAAPETFEAIVRRYIAASPLARRSFASRMRAALNLMRALLTPAPDLDAIARRLEFPALAHASLAADSTRWRRSHDAPARQAPSTPHSPKGARGGNAARTPPTDTETSRGSGGT
jgi:uncharacterized protein YbjT (DUF2867 family)